jgi:hypothetical protein
VKLPRGIKVRLEVEPLGGERTRLSVYAVDGKVAALLAKKDYERPEQAWRKVAALGREQMVEIGLEREAVVVDDGA